jgi:hypothetical protein
MIPYDGTWHLIIENKSTYALTRVRVRLYEEKE